MAVDAVDVVDAVGVGISRQDGGKGDGRADEYQSLSGRRRADEKFQVGSVGWSATA